MTIDAVVGVVKVTSVLVPNDVPMFTVNDKYKTMPDSKCGLIAVDNPFFPADDANLSRNTATCRISRLKRIGILSLCYRPHTQFLA